MNMAFSVNTNAGAMAALQSLSTTNKSLAETQSRINTGYNVASTKDDSAAFAIAQTLSGDMGGLKAVSSSLSRAKSVTDVAVAGAEQISDVVNQMKAKAYQSADAGIDTSTRTALNNDFVALRDQITTIVKNAVFNGFNLVDGSTTQITALASADGARRVTTAAQNLKLSGTIVTVKTTSTISTQAKASSLVATIQTSLTNVNSALAKLSSGAAKFSIQATFAQKLSDTLTQGIGNLVDANMAQESAKLQSLQVKQQLGVQALSIANQAPQTILSLFR
jgi:flagellin